ncbi:hypothetical protein BX661DRAFT_2315 [Kickxella alabastrina]|uniref:uncharacterized protein n=1 Tax=Kickxella alabastrina TaxID=61397 RepID=UPI0022200A04|nr:uncharacterized protein BX661DRAFT_2315 [Kickxella alabastrina]KAI7834602.1 hypothetical protein BX661DRAFT_2315 [Kickxella alabastrina]
MMPIHTPHFIMHTRECTHTKTTILTSQDTGLPTEEPVLANRVHNWQCAQQRQRGTYIIRGRRHCTHFCILYYLTMTAQVARIVALSKQLDSAHTRIWDLRSQFSEVTTTTTSNASADKEALHNQLDNAHADIENLRGKLMASQEKANE